MVAVLVIGQDRMALQLYALHLPPLTWSRLTQVVFQIAGHNRQLAAALGLLVAQASVGTLWDVHLPLPIIPEMLEITQQWITLQPM